VTRESLHKNPEHKKKLITTRVPVSAPRSRRTPIPTTDGSGPLPRTQEETPVLIEMGTPLKKTAPSESDLAQASRLHQIITTHHRIGVPWSKRSWAEHVRKLRSDLGGDAARVERALDFLEKHGADKYCPKVTCAQKLREKILAIETAIDRQPKPVTISNEAQALAIKLGRELSWRGNEMGLPEAIQRSFDNFSEFQTKLYAIKDEGGRYAKFAKRLLATEFGGRTATIRDWFRHVNDRILRWKDWSGRFDPFIWAAGHADVATTGRAAAESWSNAFDWDKLLKEMGYGDE
jgi:hypothetical protein